MERMVKMAAVPSVLLFIFLMGPASITVKTTSTNYGDLYQPQVGRSASKRELLNSAADANGIAYDGRTKDSSTLIDSNPINNNLLFTYDPNVLGGYSYDVNNIGSVYNMYGSGNIPAVNVYNPANGQTAYEFNPYNSYGYSPQDTGELYVYNPGDTPRVFASSQSNGQTISSSAGLKNIYDAKYSYGSYPGEAKNTFSLYPSDSKNGYNLYPNNDKSNYVSYQSDAKNSYNLLSSDPKNNYGSNPTDPKSSYTSNLSESKSNPSEAGASKENNLSVSEAASRSKQSDTMGNYGNNLVASSSETKQTETKASNANKLSTDEKVSASKPSDIMGGFGNTLSESNSGTKQKEAKVSNENNLSGSETTSGSNPNAEVGSYGRDFGVSGSGINPSESKSSNEKNFSAGETHSETNPGNAMSGYRNGVERVAVESKQGEIKPSNENNLNAGESASGPNSYDVQGSFGNNFAESNSETQQSEAKNSLSVEQTASRSNPSDAMGSYGNSFSESASGKNPSNAKPTNENNVSVDGTVSGSKPSDIMGDFGIIISGSPSGSKESEAEASNENNISGSETTSGSNPNDIMGALENFGESAPGTKQSEANISNENSISAGETNSGSKPNDVMGNFENNFGELGSKESEIKTSNENNLSAVLTVSDPNNLIGSYGNNFAELSLGTKATNENNLNIGETSSYDAMSNFGMKLGESASGTNTNGFENRNGDNLSVYETAPSSNPSDTVNSFGSIFGKPFSGTNANVAKTIIDNNLHGSEISSGFNPSDRNYNQGINYEGNVSNTSPSAKKFSIESNANYGPEYGSFPKKVKKKYRFHSGKGKTPSKPSNLNTKPTNSNINPTNSNINPTNSNILLVKKGENARSRYLSELRKALMGYPENTYVPYNSFVDIPGDIYSGHNRHNSIANVRTGAYDINNSRRKYIKPSAEAVPAHRMNVGQFAAPESSYNGIVHAVYPPKSSNTLVLPSKLYANKYFNNEVNHRNHLSQYDSSKTFLPNGKNTSCAKKAKGKPPHKQELKLKGQSLWKPRSRHRPRIGPKQNGMKFRLHPYGKGPVDIPGYLHISNPICADTSNQGGNQGGNNVELNRTEPVCSGPQGHRTHYFSRILNKPYIFGKYPTIPTSVHKLCPDSTFFVIENKKIYLSTTPMSDQSPNGEEEKKEGEEGEEGQEEASKKKGPQTKGETEVDTNSEVLDTNAESTTNETQENASETGHRKGDHRVTSMATTRKCHRKKGSSSTSSGNDDEEDEESDTNSTSEDPMNTLIAAKFHKGNVESGMTSTYDPDILYRYTMDLYEKLLRNNLRGWPTYDPEHTSGAEGVAPSNANEEEEEGAAAGNITDNASPGAESGGNVGAEVPENVSPVENATEVVPAQDASPTAKIAPSVARIAPAAAKSPTRPTSPEIDDDVMSPIRKALCWFLGVTIALLVLIFATGLMYMFFPTTSCLTSCHSPYCSYSDDCLQCRRGNRRTYSDGTRF